MKFTIAQEELKAALARLQSCIERTPTIPVLQNVLIESIADDKLKLTATNLDVTIETEATTSGAIKDADKAICVSASKLFNIVRALPASQAVSITKQPNEWITLTCAKSNYKIAGVEPDKYAERPKTGEMGFSIPSETFRQMIERTAFAITNEQSRFTLSGAKVEVRDGSIRMVATDGHRLAYTQIPFPNAPKEKKGELDLLIPKKALYEIAKLGFSGGIQFGADTNHVFATGGGTTVTARRLSGNFPNYEQVMPTDNSQKAVVGAEDLKAAIRRVSLMADDRLRKISIALSSGEMKVFAESSDEGASEEILPCDYKGDDITLLFQWAYVYEFLNVATKLKPEARPDDKDAEAPTDTRVAISFKDENAPVEFGVEGDERWRYIAMPLRA